MNIIERITVTEDATLISLNDSPADIRLVATIFEMIRDAGIDVDMISQSPPNGQHSSLSFTVSGDDFGGILDIVAKLRSVNPDLKISVSGGNCKISIFGEAMKCKPGVAAKVFKAAAAVNADLRMICTSETDISLLIVKADVDAVINAIRAEFA